MNIFSFKSSYVKRLTSNLEPKHHIFYVINLREVLLKGLFHAVLEGHLGVRAAAAGALQLHLHDIVGAELYELDVAAVLLKVGANLVNDRDNFLF